MKKLVSTLILFSIVSLPLSAHANKEASDSTIMPQENDDHLTRSRKKTKKIKSEPNQDDNLAYIIADQVTRSSDVDISTPQAKNQDAKKTIDASVILNFMKNNKAATGGIIAAILAAGTTGFVYFCPDNKVSKFLKEKGTWVKDTVVSLPSKAWNFTQEHYIAVSASALSLVLLGDLARGENSIIKKMLFNKQEKEKAEVDAAAAAIPAA